MNDARIKLIGWFLEIAILLGVSALFWSVNVYLAICIFTFHGFAIIQIFKTQNLIGIKKSTVKTNQRVQAALLVFTVLSCLSIQFWKNGIPTKEVFLSVSVDQSTELSNGEFFPYIAMICLLSALLIFGLTAERKRR